MNESYSCTSSSAMPPSDIYCLKIAYYTSRSLGGKLLLAFLAKP